MRLLNISLMNYIGIYNGTGKNEISFNFYDKRGIIAIRGENGSGKSTLLRAINPFPDKSEALIPGLPAKKELKYSKGDDIYDIIISYPVRNNGERATTQMAILKNGADINPSLNVSTAKEIIYSEFELDNNYITLSQLSSEDRGLADKRPAERKRFVNDILSDLAVYNNMYKTLNKKSSTLKGMVQSIAMKIDRLGGGDPSVLLSEISQASKQLKEYQTTRDESMEELGKSKLDLDNLELVRPKFAESKKIADELNSQIISVYTELVNIYSNFDPRKCDINLNTIDKCIELVTESKKMYEKQAEITNNLIITNIKAKELGEEHLVSIAKELEKINASIDAYNINTSVNTFMEDYKVIEDKVTSLKSKIHPKLIDTNISIDILDFILLQLNRQRDYFVSNITWKDREPINAAVISDSIKHQVEYLKTIATELEEFKAKHHKDITINEYLLDKVPEKCKIKDCYFRKLVEEQSKENKKISEINKKIEAYTNKFQAEQNSLLALNSALEYAKFREVVDDILNTNLGVIQVLDDIRVFNREEMLIDDLIEYFESFRDQLNMKKEYEAQYKTWLSMKEKYYNIKDNVSKIKDLEAQRDNLLKEQDMFRNKNDLYDNDIKYTTIKLETQKQLIQKADKFIQNASEYKRLAKERKTAIDLYESYKKVLDMEPELQEHKAEVEKCIQDMSLAIRTVQQKIDSAKHNIAMLEEYTREYKTYNENYKKIEVIKKYTSPTTGIQTLFMETYMNNVLIIANQLLSLMFNGRFVLQPFIINETEFRIPCAGNGYLNDDISSMSTSQICIISMIISFAMLYNSSSCYNILKLDEIDGGLDTNNRLNFIHMLNDVMRIMHCEQCFIISHNAELDDAEITTIEMR